MLKKPEQPCGRDCTRRAAGCAATCPDWAEYVKARDAYYDALYSTKEDDRAIRERAINRFERRMKRDQR